MMLRTHLCASVCVAVCGKECKHVVITDSCILHAEGSIVAIRQPACWLFLAPSLAPKRAHLLLHGPRRRRRGEDHRLSLAERAATLAAVPAPAAAAAAAAGRPSTEVRVRL